MEFHIQHDKFFYKMGEIAPSKKFHGVSDSIKKREKVVKILFLIYLKKFFQYKAYL